MASSSNFDPSDRVQFLARHFGMEYMHVLPIPNPAAIAALPDIIARRYSVAPVEVDETETLRLATSSPNDLAMMDEVTALLRRRLEFIAAPPNEVARVIGTSYP